MSPEDDEQESIPISALEHFSYCARQCALIHIDDIFVQNIHTTCGNIAHERVDEPTERQENNMRVERALPLWSQKFGLTGRADVVEFHSDVPCPVEYKLGRQRTWQHEAIQICAQGLCLEEMFGVDVPCGAIYYHGSRSRRFIAFDQSLRTATIEMIEAIRVLLRSGQLPPAVNDERCDWCSLKEACMPGVVVQPDRIRLYQKYLFHIEE